jgi:hypothetical protein
MQMTQHPLVGQWRLVRYEAIGPNVDVAAPAHRVGFLLYSPDGWMAEAIQIRPDNSSVAPTSLFYCGRYEIDGVKVVHIPAFHTHADSVGHRLERTFHIEDGANANHFTLIAPRPDGAVHLHWERLEP